MFCFFACAQLSETGNDYPALKPVLKDADMLPAAYRNRPHGSGVPAPEEEFFPEFPDGLFFREDDAETDDSASETAAGPDADEEKPPAFPEGPKGIHGTPLAAEDTPETEPAAEAPAAPEDAPELAETVFPVPPPQDEISSFPEITPDASQLEFPAELAQPSDAPPPAPPPLAAPPPPAAPPQPPPAAQPQPPLAAPPRPAPPPPVPPFIRPSEPLPPPEPAREIPQITIPGLPARTEPLAAEPLRYSRMITAYTGQYVEIPFRGPGWVYLGEQGSRRGMYYDSRRVDSEGMVFVFRAGEEGVYALKFNRQDFIRDTLLNDYVQITVKAAPEITGSAWNSTAAAPDRIYAGPRWPPAAGAPPPGMASAAGTGTADAENGTPPLPAAAQNGAESAAGTGIAAGTANAAASAPETAANAGVPAGSLPSAYLTRAKEEYDAGRPAGALDILDQFRIAYPGGSDEAYWLYGQALEANGPSRDVRRALDYYRRLTNEYPQSSHYDAARQRIAYLERFYFNIR
jgi:hypothetical protein